MILLYLEWVLQKNINVVVMKEEQYIEQLFTLNGQLTSAEKEKLRENLTVYLNYLLLHDFDKLVYLLYRVDVNEKKVKELLQKNTGTDAAVIIADLLLQRQEEKIKTKQAFQPRNDIPEEDKW